jgi:hypothetical protein
MATISLAKRDTDRLLKNPISPVARLPNQDPSSHAHLPSVSLWLPAEVRGHLQQNCYNILNIGVTIMYIDLQLQDHLALPGVVSLPIVAHDF